MTDYRFIHTLVIVAWALALHSGLQAEDIPTANTTEWRFTGDSAQYVDSVYGPGTLEYGDGDDGPTDTNDLFDVTDDIVIPHIGGVPTPYLNFKARTANTEGYMLRTGIESPLDLGVFQFTMVFDMYIEVSNNDPYLGIWNGNATNTNDDELFLRPIDGGYWAGSILPGTWQKGVWNRFVFVNEYDGAQVQTMYLNGSLVAEFSEPVLDFLWDGDPLPGWFLTDNTPGETSEGYIANFAFVDALLDTATIASLGGPSAAGIFEMCAAGPPTDLICESSGDDVALSFNNNGPYDGGIEVYRDGVLIDTIADPLAVDYTDAGPCLGTYSYFLRGISTMLGCSSWSTTCTVDHGIEGFESQNTPIPIPDADPVGVVDTVDFTDAFVVSDLHCEVEIVHSWIGDLEFTLTSPGGTTVALKSAGGANFDNVFSTFADSGEAYDIALLPTGATVQPEGPGAMADFNGENTAGVWSLTVADSVVNDVGALTGWKVIAYGASCPVTPPIDLAVTGSAPGIDLTWNNDGNVYSEIEVLRNGAVIASLPGSATAYTDSGLGPNVYSYVIRGHDSTATPCCSAASTVAVINYGIDHLVWAAEGLAGATDSTQVLLDRLGALGYQAASVGAILGVDLDSFATVWVQLGTYPDNHVLSLAEGEALTDYLQNGADKSLYVMGGDTWAYDPQTLLDDFDGTTGTADGSPACDVPSVSGLDSGVPGGLDLEGIDGSLTGECSYVDHLEADSIGAGAVQVSNGATGQFVSIFFDGQEAGLGNFKVVTSSIELGSFQFPGVLMEAYVQVFEPSILDAFRRGDSNDDGGFDISDAVFSLAALFTPGSPLPNCVDSGDANDDGSFDISDAVYTLGALFTPGSPPPLPPHPDCGSDPTDDTLGCTSYAGCP